MRRAAKVDGNHTAIVSALREAGASVLSLAALGRGVPDLLVCGPDWCRLVEVKMPKGKPTPDQVRFSAAWGGPPVVTVRTVEDALAWLALFPL